jgi:hypothetical protein
MNNEVHLNLLNVIALGQREIDTLNESTAQPQTKMNQIFCLPMQP